MPQRMKKSSVSRAHGSGRTDESLAVREAGQIQNTSFNSASHGPFAVRLSILGFDLLIQAQLLLFFPFQKIFIYVISKTGLFWGVRKEGIEF